MEREGLINTQITLNGLVKNIAMQKGSSVKNDHLKYPSKLLPSR